MTTVQTSYGEVPLEVLVNRFETFKAKNRESYLKRAEYLKSEEGKEWNRQRAKAHYEKHKEEILAKRKAKYVSRKRTPGSSTSEGQTE